VKDNQEKLLWCE